MRREYGAAGLDLPDLADDPIAMFRRWLDDASGLHEPNAMVVSSVGADGRPSARMVLLKAVDERGFVFYTNYASRKAAELDAHPQVALLFPWHDLQRQVRVEGVAARVSHDESAAYFATRPRASQLGAWASPQSQPVTSREALDAAYRAVQERFGGPDADDEVPLPPYWGGYRVAPDTVEFWQGRVGRMHDRLVYRRTGVGWGVERLAP
ncbi:MAG: pyridoxamine 5'-phosphate oxidase [Nocardioidaceae bacterium]|nr:pyridoxamine 5'-phosphate oxidase [Nocardioidaceae bacterium]NUS51896.1 pyridoxamine 5'-phosphate oxidase [Nocardioidaceae bacterium]